MRALSFFFALLAGLVLAFIAPAMAGGREPAATATLAPEFNGFDAMAPDLQATDLQAADPQGSDQLLASLLGELNLEQAPATQAPAIDAAV